MRVEGEFQKSEFQAGSTEITGKTLSKSNRTEVWMDETII